jgi:FkbM family methyltransferase
MAAGAVEGFRWAWRRLGALVGPAASRLLWWSYLAARRRRHRVSVGGVEASFLTATRAEYRRASTLLGERHVVRAFVDALEGPETVWDVGACVGRYACVAAVRATTGQVVAFEPEPTNRERLVHNLRTNAAPASFRIENAALTDRDGAERLDRGRVKAGNGRHRLVPRNDDGRAADSRHLRRTGDRGPIPVRGRRGDSLVAAGVPAPDVLKLAVEGAELDVLCGLGDVLDNVEMIVAELHADGARRYGTTPDEVEAFLLARGFGVSRLDGPGRERSYHVLARRLD